MSNPVDPTASAPPDSRWRGLLLAIGLSCAAGLVFAVAAAASSSQLINPRVADWLTQQPLITPTFVGRVSWFVLAHLLLYVGFGVVAWLLACASERSFANVRWSRRRWSAAWIAGLTVWITSWNVAHFPESVISQYFCCELVPHRFFGALSAFLTSALALALAALAWKAALARPQLRKIGARVAVYTALAGAALSVWQATRHSVGVEADSPSGSRPNVIVIGVDSLRADYIGATGEQAGYTPNIDAFLSEGVVFSDAVTPLARTYPAWVSILTGQSPVRSGVRENLFDADPKTYAASIAHRFRESGYRTVYGTDEVRFANIDARFGFDEIVSPRMGVTDFLLASLSDAPLANLAANTWVGERLFPDTYANRAAAAVYEPQTFVERIAARLVRSDEPLFLAVHLALPHWPYTWAAGSNVAFSRISDTRYQYSASIIEADEQFGRLIRALEERGVLDDAIVVVLSDHGEALGLSRDNLLFSRAAKQAVGKLSVSMWGHGNSVFSPHQYSVVLGFRGFGRSVLPLAQVRRALAAPASLEDIAPTILGLARVPDEAMHRDGVDWSAVLRDPNAALEREQSERFRYTETGYIVGFGAKGEVDAAKVAESGVQKYRIDGATGRITVRREALPALLLEKERAVISNEWVLGSARQEGRWRFILVHKRSGEARELDGPPPQSDAPAFELWRALDERYGRELRDLEAG